MKSVAQLGNTLLRHLPNGVRWSCCYGSKVMEPTMAVGSQIDMLIAVDEENLQNWHQENMRINPLHYSRLNRILGVRWISMLQRISPPLFFHPFIEIPSLASEFKYGVVSSQELENDLKNWTHFYIAGRLQKPVLSLVEETPPTIQQAIDKNLLAALCCAIILMDRQSFTEQELYLAITGLSYQGDVRMRVAENPNKVSNIVLGQPNSFLQFQALYSSNLSFLQNFGLIKVNQENRCIEVPLAANLFKFIPWNMTSKEALHQKLVQTNHISSRRQSLKGLLTAGVTRSLNYAIHKLKKRFGA